MVTISWQSTTASALYRTLKHGSYLEKISQVPCWIIISVGVASVLYHWFYINN